MSAGWPRGIPWEWEETEEQARAWRRVERQSGPVDWPWERVQYRRFQARGLGPAHETDRRAKS